ncbi:MAG: ankyrin repeat domain-containing protein [Cytophagaceae bacterium]|nr:ankyrin repeat domain-containing protein [Gemmatimonadaceae bacterium]
MATHLPLSAPLEAYESQAAALLRGHAAGERAAIDQFHENHPRFLDEKVTWLPLPLSDEEIAQQALTIDDARLAVARSYGFRDWDALASLVNEAAREGSPVREFEYAVEAVIVGDESALRERLAANPALVLARSSRVTNQDPSVHGATLLHYVAANGVEGYRQRTPANVVEIARILLEAGAEVDARAGMYGGEYATLSMLVSSSPPAGAGMQVPLVHVLLDHGAAIEGVGMPKWHSPLMTALIFGFRDAAEALVSRGAKVDRLEVAAGLGRVGDATALLPSADEESRHRALALATMCGQVGVARRLLEAGVDPSRRNPDGFHGHATPLHHAAHAGHLEMVALLVRHGARVDLRDSLWQGTPLDWAEHGEQDTIAAFLRSQGAQE